MLFYLGSLRSIWFCQGFKHSSYRSRAQPQLSWLRVVSGVRPMSLWYPRSTFCTIHARAAKIFSGHMTACCRCHIISNMACAEFLLKSGMKPHRDKRKRWAWETFHFFSRKVRIRRRKKRPLLVSKWWFWGPKWCCIWLVDSVEVLIWKR